MKNEDDTIYVYAVETELGVVGIVGKKDTPPTEQQINDAKDKYRINGNNYENN